MTTTNLNNCTLRQALREALFGGLSRRHFLEAQAQEETLLRIGHLALGIIEGMPFLGRAVSLVEMGILRHIAQPSPTRPQPTSNIPSTEKIKRQETPDDPPRFWPKDLTRLGLTESQANEIDTHIRDAFEALRRGQTISFDYKKLRYGEKDATLPIALSIIKGNRVILFSKQVFAVGGERKIRWAYDLTSGEFFLKKRIVGRYEKVILDLLEESRANRGLDMKDQTTRSSTKKGVNKIQLIEKVRDGDLTKLFGTSALAPLATKRNIILDILSDLLDLHKIRISNYMIPVGQEMRAFSYDAFHADLKPSNILVWSQEDRWRAMLSDFGMPTADLLIYSISEGYTPPEYIKFYQSQRPLGMYSCSNENENENGNMADFNTVHGKGRDIWSLGLVIISLLMEDEKAVWGDLPQQDRRTPVKGIFPPYKEEWITSLTQDDLDAHMDELKRTAAPCGPQEERKIWMDTFEMVTKNMLRIDPKERYTAQECLTYFQTRIHPTDHVALT